jgi:hypothetical protein
LTHHPSPWDLTHDTWPIFIQLNQSSARFMHPVVLSNIFLRESRLFMPDVILKYEIWKYEKRKKEKRKSQVSWCESNGRQLPFLPTSNIQYPTSHTLPHDT